MIECKKAIKLIEKQKIKIQPKEKIKTIDSLGRFLAEEIYSKYDSPPFDKSAMDGYTYNSEDENQKKLEIKGVIAAGDFSKKKINKNECMKIMTGAPIPSGADKVVKIENVHEKENKIEFKPEKETHIIKKGSDTKSGEKIIKPKKLSVKEIGLLASLGYEEISVFKKLKVGVITTGTELKNPGEELNLGQIYNSNGYQITNHAKSVECDVTFYGTVSDDKAKTKKIIQNAVSENELVILSGGVSRGDFDYVPEMVEEIGFDIIFHRIAFKPGKPTLLARKKNKFIFGLPGNPVSTFVVFEVFVKKLIYKFYGFNFQPKFLKGKLVENASRKKTVRKEYQPVFLDNKGFIHQINYQGSFNLSAYEKANAFLIFEVGEASIKKEKDIYVRQI